MTRDQAGFTLIELVVVILVLGIVTATTAPKLLTIGRDAGDVATRRSLVTIREAIDRFRAESGAWPGQSNDLPGDLRPYLSGAFPASDVGTRDALVGYVTGSEIEGESSPATGWRYSTDSGEFIVNSTETTVVDPAIAYDDW